MQVAAPLTHFCTSLQVIKYQPISQNSFHCNIFNFKNMFAKKNCLYIGREKEYGKKNVLAQATDSIINFYLDHPLYISANLFSNGFMRLKCDLNFFGKTQNLLYFRKYIFNLIYFIWFLIFVQIYDVIKAGTVNWDKVNTKFSTMNAKKIQQVISYINKLNSLINLFYLECFFNFHEVYLYSR